MWDDDLVARVYDAALDPKGWDAFLKALEESFGGAVVALSLPHPRRGDRGELIAPSLDPRFVESYRDRYFALDPLKPETDQLPVGSFAWGSDSIPAAKLQATVFNQEWLDPQDLQPGPLLEGVVERDAVDGRSLLSVFLPRGVRRERRAEKRLGEHVMPHLTRAVRIHFRRAQLKAEQEALRAAFDQVPMGLILVDARGRVRAKNRVADQLLAERDGLALDRDGLRAARIEQTEELRRLLAEAARTPDKGPFPSAGLLLPRLSGRRALEVAVSPIRVANEGLGSERCLAALFVGDPEQGMQPPRELLHRFYGLTPAEGALACELASGRSLEEAAERLGVTRGTARQRLQHIFNKTATCRQAALVRLLLTGPTQLRAQE